MVEINYLFFSFLALCILVLGLVAILAIFCYKQENIKLLLKLKTDITSDKVSSEVALDIDKENKKENSK